MQGKDEKAARPGHCVLRFRLFCDEGFKKDPENQRTGLDPCDLKSEEGSVELVVYRCIKSGSESAVKLLEEDRWPMPSEDGWQDIGLKSMKAYYKRYLLENYITKQDTIQNDLDELTSKNYKVPDEPS